MIVIDQSKLQEVIAAYKKYFPTHIGDEIYKWKAVKRFQDKWNIDAPNFLEMFWEATGFFDNLLASVNHFPRKMIRNMCEAEPDTVRQMFRDLFDESRSLAERVNHFRSESDRIRKQYWPNKMHYQDLNAISIYLWARFPDKYYIYKYSEARFMAQVLNSSYVVRKGLDASGLMNAYEFFDLIREAILKDPDIRPMLNSVLTSDCYRDVNLNCVVGDICYYVYRYFGIANTPSFFEAFPNNHLSRLVYDYAPIAEDCNYWFLVGNPSVWSMSDWKDGEEQKYTLLNKNGHKRRIHQNFLNAKKGDRVICYQARPTKQIVALATISKESDGESVCFKKEETLLTPIPFPVIKKAPGLEGMEFLMNPNGSLFKLTKEEYTIIMDFIRNSIVSANLQSSSVVAYSRDAFLREVYLSEDELDDLEFLLRNKRNIILQGAPGVGKTFCARRLAYEIMGEKDDNRVCLVQFHQNYSYEDFILGYKPVASGFDLQEGVFYRFCKDAADNPDKPFFFIIDEINRGNLSKIFGELLMLIEKDYRGEKLTLAYRNEKFFVPKNLYIIGMMNTADRSLAMIDYALRRRFSFFDMRPGFDSDGFKKYQAALANAHFDSLIKIVKELNKAIAADESLGEGFELGHSYFCGQKSIADEWLRHVIKYDLVPMLQEYWFDNRKEVEKWEKALNTIFND